MDKKIIIGTFFLVSFASLTYQVTWLRLLIQIFGSSIYAVSTLLTSFMAGLALGSFVGGNYIDNTEYPVEFYGKLLFSIGIIGLLTNYGFGPLYTFSIILFNVFNESFILNEIEFLLGFVSMIVPTTLLGGVFPVVNKLLVGDEVGGDVGLIYSLNNIAASAGSVITGFFLLAFLGITKTIILVSFATIFSGVYLFYFHEEKL